MTHTHISFNTALSLLSNASAKHSVCLSDSKFGKAELAVVYLDINNSSIAYTPTQIYTYIWIWSKQAGIWLISADGQHTIYMAQSEPGGA